MEYYCIVNVKTGSLFEETIKIEYPDIEFIEGLDNLKTITKAGDTVVFDNILELDQTNTNDFDCIYQNYTWFVDNGVQLTFDRSPNCDYSRVKSNCDKFLDDKAEITYFDMFRLILKMEVEAYINIKTAQATRKRNAQLSACRVTGKSYGRPKGSKSESEKAKNAMNIIFENSRMFNGELTDSECIALAGVPRASYYRYKRKLMNKLIKAEL